MPTGFFTWETVVLRKFSSVAGGALCAQVVPFGVASLTLWRFDSVTPRLEGAYAFSIRLAVTRDAGAAVFGAGPGRWTGSGFFGPLSQTIVDAVAVALAVGQFLRRRAVGSDGQARSAAPGCCYLRAIIDAVLACCCAGDLGDDGPLVRLHGYL
nr:hypothetical protein [Mycobacterium uberis]